MERGTRLEDEALERFSKETEKELDASLIMWTRDDNENIALSPDGVVVGEPEAVECKCLSSARHIEAFITKKIPAEYEEQALQYFIVNEKLEMLYFVFYDPRFPKGLDFFYIEILRAEKEEDIKFYLDYQKQTLDEVNEIVNKLTF